MNAKLKPTAHDDTRIALSAAIEAAHKADRDLQRAIAAEEKAMRELHSAHRALDAVHDEAIEPDVDAIIVALSGDDAVATLNKPLAEREAREAEAQRNIDALRQVRERLEFAVDERRAAAEAARSGVDRATREVIRTNIDIDMLLEQTQRLQSQVLVRRCMLMNLQDQLPHDSAEREAIAKFMARAWLSDELSYARNAAGEPIRAFAQALKSDADAPVPTLPA